MNELNQWCSITASVDRVTRDNLAAIASSRGTTIASLIKKALRIYLAPGVQLITQAGNLDDERAILQAIEEFARHQSDLKKETISEQIIRLNCLTERILFLATGKNEMLFRQIVEQVQRHVENHKSHKN